MPVLRIGNEVLYSSLQNIGYKIDKRQNVKI